MFTAAKPVKTSAGTKKHPSKIFEDTVLTLIILSSITLAIDNPLYDPESRIVSILSTIDIVFTCLFFVEAMIKIIAKGLYWNHLGPI